MRKEVLEHIQKKPEWMDFLHEQPTWYKKLSRNPRELEAFELAALQYHKKTIPHRVEQFSNSIQMARMMVQMFMAMNQKD